ncbi:hypothetical protein OX283_009835 [Flavobacterium sp. SUN052]|uniref:hypothetical protein n=1 Tax=Flavobacterium sp. SUN052 TaxID=3002441 RepID=UPI00237EBB5D|nr:hypothetical protein [Flavobacterium sp. SUN052]MEC4004956.1 hypothetical protein [Flavobacterium sp. SUN052]
MKKNILVLIIILIHLFSFGQSKFDISYNETITLKKLEKTTIFTISSDYGIVNLTGDAINQYKFKKPGIYLIQVIQKIENSGEECNHPILPSQITVNVSRIKMKFDSSKLKFSELIKKNTETSGSTLSIPVVIETFDNKSVMMNVMPINSSGIGTSITATLKNEFQNLSTGKHILVYDLKGITNQNSFLMFDFIDANGKIQSVSLKSPIEN